MLKNPKLLIHSKAPIGPQDHPAGALQTQHEGWGQQLQGGDRCEAVYSPRHIVCYQEAAKGIHSQPLRDQEDVHYHPVALGVWEVCWSTWTALWTR